MLEPITMIKTAQEVLKQTIETQLTEMKMLVSHAPQVATSSTTPSAVIDPKGNQHRFITVMPISIRQPSAQEGLQEAAAQLDLAALPSETLRTLQAQIAEEFNDRQQLVRAENASLRQEKDNIERKYHKAATLAMQRKKDEVSMRKSMAELFSELLDMQLEDDASVIDKMQKVVLHTKALVVRMDTVEVEQKVRIEELEKRDLTEQLKATAKEIAKQIAYQIVDTTHLLETTTESWMGIEQITIVEEVREEI